MQLVGTKEFKEEIIKQLLCKSFQKIIYEIEPIKVIDHQTMYKNTQRSN